MIKHMNAKPLTKEKREKILNDPNYIVEEKLKGIRAFLTFTSEGCKLLSRGGHDISHRFPHLSKILIKELEGITLDGELFQRGIEDEVIAGWGNWRTKYIDPEVTKNVRFMAFDMFNTNWNLEDRKDHLHYLLSKLYISNPNSLILEVPSYPIRVAKEYFEEVMEDGGEGIMLKNLNSFYIPGKRPEGIWYKWKGEETFDVIITGFEPPEQYSLKKGDVEETETRLWKNGWIGKFRYGMYLYDGLSLLEEKRYKLVELGTCSGMTDGIRHAMTQHPEKWVGKVVEIKGVEQKPSGAIDNPRFIRIRIDKEPEECIWQK